MTRPKTRYQISKALLISDIALLCALGMGEAATVDRIAAIVNEDVITEADVSASAEAMLDRPDEASAEQAPKMREFALQRLIEQRLLLQEARKAGVTVESAEVLRRFDQFRERLGSPEEVADQLRQMAMSEEQVREKIRDQLLVQQLVDAKVRATITVSPQEVASELSQHPELAKKGDRIKASHILIRVTEARPVEQARALIEDIRRQALAGAEFEQLARQYSEDDQKDDGGRMDWVAEGELMPELDAALFALKPGEISAPINSRLGVHLLRVDDRRASEHLSLTEAHRSVYQQIYQRKFQDAFLRWIGDIKRKAYIEIPNI